MSLSDPNIAIYDLINRPTDRDYPQVPLDQLIAEQCERTPDAIAVLGGDVVMTYSQLNEKSDRVASYLVQQGIKPGDLVGLCCNRDVDTPAMLVGIMKSGAGYVPLDPDYPAERLAYMVEDSGLRHILAHGDQQQLVDTFKVPNTLIDRDWNQIEAATAVVDVPAIDTKKHIAYVIYTSGSTGRPKGVMVPHRAAVNFVLSMKECPGFSAEDRIMATTTLSFDISVAEIFLPLTVGGSVAVVDRETARDTPALIAAMERYQVNYMQATPAMWRMILETEFAGRPEMKFFSAGEPLPRDLIAPLLERCGELWNLYGPTETTVYSTGKQVLNDNPPVLIGLPFANTQVYIVDENDQLCPTETPGELLIAGDGVTLGYLNRPEKNEEVFVHWNEIPVYPVSYTHLTLPTIYSV